MGNVRKPLKRGILSAFALFITSLCLVLSIMQYVSYRETLYRKYREYITNILTYTASAIDTDDLGECIRTGKESAKYQELQTFMDKLKDNVNLQNLYVIIPANTNESDNIVNVIAARSSHEREYEPGAGISLNMPSGTSYSPDIAGEYLDAYNSGGLSFFEEVTEWGDDYTGLLPLYDSSNQKIAALCMDVEVHEIHEALLSHTLNMVMAVIFLGILFAVAFIIWTDVNIIGPIRKLESCMVRYASRSHGQNDPNALVMQVPEIHTGNEVETLSLAVQKMSVDMRDYMNGFAAAKKELEKVNAIAHRDGLTHVGNKIAYEQYAMGLNRKMGKEDLEYLILVLDLNGLMDINSSYGHEKGDLYLRNCCTIVCNVFKRSPVFRMGGDEFTVILIGHDYIERDNLLAELKNEFRRTMENPDAEPWERLSTAMGAASYVREKDNTVYDVYQRAEKLMLEDKRKMKEEITTG